MTRLEEGNEEEGAAAGVDSLSQTRAQIACGYRRHATKKIRVCDGPLFSVHKPNIRETYTRAKTHTHKPSDTHTHAENRTQKHGIREEEEEE